MGFNPVMRRRDKNMNWMKSSRKLGDKKYEKRKYERRK